MSKHCKNDPTVNVQKNVQGAVNRMEDHIQEAVNRQQKNIQGAVNRMEGNIDKAIDNLEHKIEKTLDKTLKLDTLEKRKKLIDTIFKKDKKTGKIFMKSLENGLFEYHTEKLRTFQFISEFKIESIDENYTDIYLKNVYFGPHKSEFADGSTFGIIESRLIDTRLFHITYNNALDTFTLTVGMPNNTLNLFGQFNSQDNFNADYWENEDPRSKRNAFIGKSLNYTNITSDELPEDIFKMITEKTFDELYELIWEKNHQPKLINTLYYKLKNNNGHVYNLVKHKSTEGGESGYAASLLLTNNKWESIPGTLITVNGYFIYPNNADNSGINDKMLYEKFVIRDSDGDKFKFSGSYEEESETSDPEISDSDKVEFIGLGGTGKYKNISHVFIEFYNDTNITKGEGAQYTRCMKVYGK